MSRHPATHTWTFPEDRPVPHGVSRVNLRELVARPERFEHHLMVVGSVGSAQIEVVTASEPLFFQHGNISDEYAMSLPTGDHLLDTFPFRTFLADPGSNELVARIRHAMGHMVLHPHGLLHWPGKLRPPYEPPEFPGARRCGLSLVFCATEPTPVGERPLAVSSGLEAHVKAYRGTPPFHLVDVMAATESMWLGQIGDTRMDLFLNPTHLRAPGYLVVLEATEQGGWFPCDLVHVSEPTKLSGIRRGLFFSGASVAAPPPSWTEVPTPLMAAFDESERLPLPLSVQGIVLEAVDDAWARVRIGSSAAVVPRYWLARMLFRLPLHDFALGYLETYEGFYYDDRGGHRLGIRGGEAVCMDRPGIESVVRSLYRAVAPSGYSERLS